MQIQKSNFAQIFLLEFTKQLIKNSKPRGIIEIEQKEKIEEPEEIKHLEKIKNTPKKIIKPKLLPTQKIIHQQISQTPIKPIQKLTIPGHKLPPRFQEIKPISTKREINLEKLNPIIGDPIVNAMECDGPNIPIKIITKTGAKRTTKIVLTKEEINTIIQTFSTITRIPALEGIYKVAAGNLILLSVISEVVGTKFVIKKIPEQLINIPKQKIPPRIPNQRLLPQRILQRQIPMQPRRMIRK